MSYEKNIVKTHLAPDAVGTYSQGVIHNGTYFFSGQIGLEPESMQMKESFDEQINQIMLNIDGLLKSQELDRTNIIKTSIFLKDLEDFGKVNEAYVNYFSKPYPARSCVEVSRLPKDALVEIEVIAAK